jgi:Flp pilus assembly pilin Flp
MRSGALSWLSLRPLLRDDRGVSMIEFALVAPVIGLMLVSITDYSMAFSERLALQSAANRTIERASLGTSPTSTTSTDPDYYKYLRAEAATAAGVPLSQVAYTPVLKCDEQLMPSFSDVCEEKQEIARYITIRIVKDFVPSFPWSGASGPIAGEATVRVQ